MTAVESHATTGAAFSGDDPSLPDSPLTREYYTSQGWHERDMEDVFHQRWLFAGHASQLTASDQNLVFELGETRVLVTRAGSGGLAAFTIEDVGARRPVRVEEWNGFVFVHLGEEQPKTVADMLAKVDLSQYELARTKVVADRTYMIEGNWKLNSETFVECYHCMIVHPEFCTIMDAFADIEATEDATADADALHGDDFVLFSPDVGPAMLKGAVTFSPDGALSCQRRLGSPGSHPSANSMLFWFPSFGLNALPDHATTFSWVPTGPRTAVFRSTWLVHEDAVAGVDFDPETFPDFIDKINREDKEIVRIAQLGVNSRAFDNSAPYHRDFEGPVRGFLRSYLRHVERHNAG